MWCVGKRVAFSPHFESTAFICIFNFFILILISKRCVKMFRWLKQGREAQKNRVWLVLLFYLPIAVTAIQIFSKSESFHINGRQEIHRCSTNSSSSRAWRSPQNEYVSHRDGWYWSTPSPEKSLNTGSLSWLERSKLLENFSRDLGNYITLRLQRQLCLTHWTNYTNYATHVLMCILLDGWAKRWIFSYLGVARKNIRLCATAVATKRDFNKNVHTSF